jgi:hypothetical protein
MALAVFPLSKQKFAGKLIDWDTDDIRVLLLRGDGGSVPTYRSTDEFVSNVLSGGNLEITAVGYSRQALTTESLNVSGIYCELKAANVTFTGLAAGQTIGAAVVYLHTGADAASSVISWYDGGSSPNELPKITGGDFQIQWSGGVVIRF